MITVDEPRQDHDQPARTGRGGSAASRRVGPGRERVGVFHRAVEREPGWAQARVTLDEMIEEAGRIPDEDRQWARSVLGLVGLDRDTA